MNSGYESENQSMNSENASKKLAIKIYQKTTWPTRLCIVGALNNSYFLLLVFYGCQMQLCDYVTGIFGYIIWPLILGIIFSPAMVLVAANLTKKICDGESNRNEVAAFLIYVVSLAGCLTEMLNW